jgi:PGF-pre-PGF domain-containing protein
MKVQKELIQSLCYLSWLVLFVLIAIIPVSASPQLSPGINTSHALNSGGQGPILTADILTISANKDSVSRGGGRFSVTITGSPGTFYNLWVKNTSAMTGEPQDQPPYIYVSETVYQDPIGGPFIIGSHYILGSGGRTIINDIPQSTANISNTEYYATIRTNNRGIATVEWNTPVAAKPGPYTIHVEGDTLTADVVVEVVSGINPYNGPVTGFAARPEKVILHPAINTINGTIANNDLTTINRAARVFIGEEGLNVSPALASAQALAGNSSTLIGWWASPADTLRYPPTITLNLAGRETNLLVSQADFDGFEGTWYLVDPSTRLAFISSGSPVQVINVASPRLDIRIWDVDWATDVTGKSIAQGENLTFRIETNLWLAMDRFSRPDITNDTQGVITIKVKDEMGASLNYLYRDNSKINVLTNLSVNTSPWFWGGGATTGQNYWATDLLDRDHYQYYPQGTYSISAESLLNNMKDNYLSGGAAYTGRTVSEVRTITLIHDLVNIESNSNSIVRGNSFVVGVSGRPFSTYHLWVENTSTMTGNFDDQPPYINPHQVGVIFDRDPGLTNSIPVFPEAGAYQFEGSGGKAIYQDVAPGWPGSTSPFLKNGTTEYANITLGSYGGSMIQFVTTNWTKPQKYTIRVEQVFPINYSAEGGDVKRDSVEVTVERALQMPTLTPDPGYSSTDSDGPSDSGTIGQTVASHPGADPGQTMTFSFSQYGGTVTISRVEIVPGQQIGPLDLIVQPVSPVLVLQVPDLTVAGYEQITPVGLNPSAIDHGTITFGVSETWLIDHAAAREDIVLMRYHDYLWDALPTRFDHKSSDIFYFNADTPGFSYFAVAVKPVGSLAVNTSTTSVLPSRVQSISAEPISQTASDWDTASQTVVNQTTATPPVASSSTAPPTPFMTLAIALIISIGFVAGAVIIRNWWISRQNPALFHKDR